MDTFLTVWSLAPVARCIAPSSPICPAVTASSSQSRTGKTATLSPVENSRHTGRHTDRTHKTRTEADVQSAILHLNPPTSRTPNTGPFKRGSTYPHHALPMNEMGNSSVSITANANNWYGQQLGPTHYQFTLLH